MGKSVSYSVNLTLLILTKQTGPSVLQNYLKKKQPLHFFFVYEFVRGLLAVEVESLRCLPYLYVHLKKIQISNAVLYLGNTGLSLALPSGNHI